MNIPARLLRLLPYQIGSIHDLHQLHNVLELIETPIPLQDFTRWVREIQNACNAADFLLRETRLKLEKEASKHKENNGQVIPKASR